MSDAIIVNNLSKSFEEVTAVKDISFSVKEAEVFAFLGPNGAGKTTTINIICGLLRPSSGTVKVNGFDVALNTNEVRKSIGVIFQDPSLDERLTVYENLDFHGMIYHMPADLRKQRIKEVLELVGLSDKIKTIVRTFSSGMKRRLEIARGLMHRPKVMILDEPTTGLDPQTRQHIWDYILDLSQQEKITIFFSTHYLDEAEVCDRLAIIDHGQITALDTPETLKQQYKLDSLNDVFLKITGYNIREEEGGARERLAQLVRKRRAK
jgi:ABC-2 type transport system ATP-binding protein